MQGGGRGTIFILSRILPKITESGSTIEEKDTLPVSTGLLLIFVGFLNGVPLSELDVDNSLSLFGVVIK